MTKERIGQYIEDSLIPKILTTYDSFSKVAECIRDWRDWRVVVDEFQILISDSSFKSDVEMQFLSEVSKCPYVTYMSATPIMDELLEEMKEFRGLPYYEIQWEGTHKIRPIRCKESNPLNAALRIIRQYQAGNYPYKEQEGVRVYSTECVIFLNSVKSIVSLVHQAGLTAEEVNLIVGDSEENDRKIAKLGEGFQRGRIPLKGEPHKKFTFCTSTAYAGCDFYSICASTFVVSDSRREHLAVDIATELIQISGRQRLAENPFRDEITILYRTGGDEMEEEEFRKEIEKKLSLTNEEIEHKNKATGEVLEKEIRDWRRIVKAIGYDDSYTMWDEKEGRFKVNELARLYEKYAYRLQCHLYRNGWSVRNAMEATGRFEMTDKQHFTSHYEEQVKGLLWAEDFPASMKQYCEHKKAEKEASGISVCMAIPTILAKYPQVRDYYEALGEDYIRAHSYKESELKKGMQEKRMEARIVAAVLQTFRKGERLTNAEVEERLQGIYEKCGCKKAVKTTTLKQYFPDAKGGQKIRLSDGRRVNGWVI